MTVRSFDFQPSVKIIIPGEHGDDPRPEESLILIIDIERYF